LYWYKHEVATFFFYRYATILAFDVKVERDAQDLADSLGVKIFQADIIYHLFDKFMAYREELRQRKREEFKHIAVFPCKLKVLPQVRKNVCAFFFICILLRTTSVHIDSWMSLDPHFYSFYCFSQ
jgi:translation initiation factor IF-2